MFAYWSFACSVCCFYSGLFSLHVGISFLAVTVLATLFPCVRRVFVFAKSSHLQGRDGFHAREKKGARSLSDFRVSFCFFFSRFWVLSLHKGRMSSCRRSSKAQAFYHTHFITQARNRYIDLRPQMKSHNSFSSRLFVPGRRPPQHTKVSFRTCKGHFLARAGCQARINNHEGNHSQSIPIRQKANIKTLLARPHACPHKPIGQC